MRYVVDKKLALRLRNESAISTSSTPASLFLPAASNKNRESKIVTLTTFGSFPCQGVGSVPVQIIKIIERIIFCSGFFGWHPNCSMGDEAQVTRTGSGAYA